MRKRIQFMFEAPEATPSHPGLEEAPATEHDLETDQGFTNRLAEKLGKEAPVVEGGSTSVQSGLTFGDQPERDPATGRFVPKHEPEAPAAPEAPEPPAEPEAPAPESVIPPEAETRFAELERQLKDAQEFIGRQASEIGQLRQQPQQPAVPAPLPVVTQEVADQVYEWVGEQGFQQAMGWALQNNRHDLHDTILAAADALGDQYAAQALDYRVNLRVQEALMAREAQHPQQPQRDPYVVAQVQRETMQSAVAKVRTETPNFDTLQPHFEKAIKDGGPELESMITSDDPQVVERGVRLATNVARGYAATELAAAAAAEAAKAVPGREAVKLAAQVATGSSRVGTGGESGDGTPTEQERAEAIQSFKDAIFNAPGTSVADGLTTE